MENFRVYTGVLRVGVEWRFLGLRFQFPSMIALLVVMMVFGLSAAGLGALGGPLWISIASLLTFVGLGLILWIVRTVGRLNGMAAAPARLRESTQAALVYYTARQPIHVNFSAPDDVDNSMAYRN